MTRGIVRLKTPARVCAECGGQVHEYSDEDETMIYQSLAWCDECKKNYTYKDFLKLKLW